MNFLSYSDKKFKINVCNTLIFRAFKICSSWNFFHQEIEYLSEFFEFNSYPSHILPNVIRKFLDKKLQPPEQVLTVAKQRIYVSLPFIGIFTSLLKKELTITLAKLYPMAEFRFCFSNPLTLQSLFKFKDSLSSMMQSGVVYKYTCPKCSLGTYIGSTDRLLQVRCCSHKGISYRTGLELTTKETSAIRTHSLKCQQQINFEDFKILAKSRSTYDLHILESLFIKSKIPTLNSDTSSTPLSIA